MVPSIRRASDAAVAWPLLNRSTAASYAPAVSPSRTTTRSISLLISPVPRRGTAAPTASTTVATLITALRRTGGLYWITPRARTRPPTKPAPNPATSPAMAVLSFARLYRTNTAAGATTRLTVATGIGMLGLAIAPQITEADNRPYRPKIAPEPPALTATADVERLTMAARMPAPKNAVANASEPTRRSSMRPNGTRPAT